IDDLGLRIVRRLRSLGHNALFLKLALMLPDLALDLFLVGLKPFSLVGGLHATPLRFLGHPAKKVFGSPDRVLNQVNWTDAGQPDQAYDINDRKRYNRADLPEHAQEECPNPVTGPAAGAQDVEIMFPRVQKPRLQMSDSGATDHKYDRPLQTFQYAKSRQKKFCATES